MRLEILAGSGDPAYFSITKQKTLIGSDPAADIVLNEDGISRKHLVLLKEGESYFIYDNGSTNGSFVNEERLIPGKRVEFTSYFPVRLGSSVLVSLVSDEEELATPEKIHIPFPTGESPQPKPSLKERPSSAVDGATKVISLKDLKSSSTKDLVEKRDKIKQEGLRKKKAEPKKKKKGSGFKFVHFVAIALVAGAAWVTLKDRKEEEKKVLQETVKAKVEEKPVERVIAEAPFYQEVETVFRDPERKKCESEEEKLLCTVVKKINEPPWGAATVSKSIFVMVDISPYIAEMKLVLPVPQAAEGTEVPQALKDQYDRDLWDVSIGNFFATGFLNKDFLKVKDKTLVFAFYFPTEEKNDLKAMVAIEPGTLNEVQSILASGKLRYVSISGAQVMNFSRKLYKIKLL